ncbi:winged helix-turn-helix transcriptional regulator [Actinomadura chokoriensis]|uniref:winged helix-turn-helix transcriptional regulator n=1 Tax=Actinomadura chokoriensis TaxID=454156 RepID=UPI0035681656
MVRATSDVFVFVWDMRCPPFDTVGGTWAMMPLISLNSGDRRYCQLKRSVPGIGDRMLGARSCAAPAPRPG